MDKIVINIPEERLTPDGPEPMTLRRMIAMLAQHERDVAAGMSKSRAPLDWFLDVPLFLQVRDECNNSAIVPASDMWPTRSLGDDRTKEPGYLRIPGWMTDKRLVRRPSKG